MKISIFFLSGLVLLVIVFGLIHSANAALTDNGDGTITQTRDDGSILMWLKDANYAKTSGVGYQGEYNLNYFAIPLHLCRLVGMSIPVKLVIEGSNRGTGIQYFQ